MHAPLYDKYGITHSFLPLKITWKSILNVRKDSQTGFDFQQRLLNYLVSCYNLINFNLLYLRKLL